MMVSYGRARTNFSIPIERFKSLARATLSAQKDSVTGLNFAECWGLDATGNWRDFRQDDDGSGWDLIQTRTSNQVNEITDIHETRGLSWITPLYNRAGNMTRIPKPGDPTNYFTATYDSWNRLVKIEEGQNTLAEYAYDGAKRRTLKKTYSGGQLDKTRHFYYTDPSRWQVLEERLESGGEISTFPDRQFLWGLRYIDDLLLRDRDTTDPKNGTLDERLYALQDANWNVTSIAGSDGTIQERYAYSAYGAPSVLTTAFATRANSDYAWESLFGGYRFDFGTVNYHVRHRNLLSRLGCWNRRDPIGYAGKDSNLYRYVRDNPLVYGDPKGLAFLPDLGALLPDLGAFLPDLGALLPHFGGDVCETPGISMGHNAGAVCSDGEVHLCFWSLPVLPDAQEESSPMLIACLLFHELHHFLYHLRPCPPCGVERGRLSGNTRREKDLQECAAYAVEKRCLQDSKVLCHGSGACEFTIDERIQQIDQIRTAWRCSNPPDDSQQIESVAPLQHFFRTSAFRFPVI